MIIIFPYKKIDKFSKIVSGIEEVMNTVPVILSAAKNLLL